uniref:Uncharacterized protein n=1 Tax=Arundo donax TaxID=35708 RepID=A0A0A9FLB7_ARUDO
MSAGPNFCAVIVHKKNTICAVTAELLRLSSTASKEISRHSGMDPGKKTTTNSLHCTLPDSPSHPCPCHPNL